MVKILFSSPALCSKLRQAADIDKVFLVVAHCHWNSLPKAQLVGSPPLGIRPKPFFSPRLLTEGFPLVTLVCSSPGFRLIHNFRLLCLLYMPLCSGFLIGLACFNWHILLTCCLLIYSTELLVLLAYFIVCLFYWLISLSLLLF